MSATHILIVAVILAWVGLIAVIFALLALARQVGVLFERIAPVGALVSDAGPRAGDRSPQFTLNNLNGGQIAIGAPDQHSATLLFFLSANCPICKQLLPVLKSIRKNEKAWLTVVLASDGDDAIFQRFIQTADLGGFAFLNSSELGMAYRVSRLPFAVLIGADGFIKAKGLINNREQLESLFNAYETGFRSIQDFLDKTSSGTQ